MGYQILTVYLDLKAILLYLWNIEILLFLRILPYTFM